MDDTNKAKDDTNTAAKELKTSTRYRSSSASIQAAMNDPRLSSSITDLSLHATALSPAGFPSADAKTRVLFEKRVKRYFYMLTTGCSDSSCNYSLCASNQAAPHFSSEVAAAMAVQLASNSKLLFCPRIPQDTPPATQAPFGKSPLTSPSSSPPPSTNHSRRNSGLKNTHASPPLSSPFQLPRSESSQKLFVELDSIPAPFLNSLFSFPSFSSLFSDGGGSAGGKHLLSDSLNPLHISRSRSAKDLGSLSRLSLQELDTSSYSTVDASSLASPLTDTSNYGGDINSVPEESIPLPMVEESIGLTFLARDLLDIAVSQYKQDPTNDSTFLLNTIHGVFSSVEALGKSFSKKEEKSLSGNVKFQNHPSGLDLDSIVSSYNIILNLSPVSIFQKRLVHAVEILLIKLYKISKQNQNPDSSILRILMIVVLNPLLSESSFHEVMIKRLCCVLGKLRSKSNGVWIKWLSRLPPTLFSSVLAIFKNYIVSVGPPQNGSKPDESFIGAIKTISVLCTANEMNSSSKLVPYSDFYLNDFVLRLNFKDEYKRWRKSLESEKVVEFALFNFPFLFDPVAKTRIMHIDAMVKMSLQYEEACVNQALIMHTQRFLDDSEAMKKMENGMKQSTNPYLVLEIRRSHFVEDVIQQITKMKTDLKKPLKIKFVGGGEEGMDQGGVQKEFFQILMSELLDPAFGMFDYNLETRYSWINSASLEANSQFEFVGIMIGLALYNGVIIRVNFPPLMYKKLLKEKIGLEDIEIAFPALGKGLRQLLEWSDGDVGDIFMRTFEISYEHYGKVFHIPLVANGSEVMVTNANRHEYVRLYVNHLVDISVQNQFRAFQRGFYKVCGGRPLAMCRPDELELLICGKETDESEFHRLEEGAAYDDGYSPSHSIIKWFWKIVHERMDISHKRMLLEFVTASDRVPLKGLASLTFVIQRNGPDTDRLPSALTCFGRLLLPEYSTIDKLEERLTTAIENAKGFGLV